MVGMKFVVVYSNLLKKFYFLLYIILNIPQEIYFAPSFYDIVVCCIVNYVI